MRNTHLDFEEMHRTIIHQLQLKQGYVKSGKQEATGFIILMGILTICTLGIIGNNFLLSISFLGPIFIILGALNLIGFEYNKTKYYTFIENLYVLTKNIHKENKDIDEILDILEKVYKIIQKYNSGKIFDKTLEKEVLLNQIQYFLMVIEFLKQDIISIINKNKAQLKIGIKNTEQISISPELNQVSETQRIRLGRQIEQFEELQRVMVKV